MPARTFAASTTSSMGTNSSGLCAWAMLPGPQRTPGILCSAYHAELGGSAECPHGGVAPEQSQRLANRNDQGVVRWGVDRRKEDPAQLPCKSRRMLRQPRIQLANVVQVAFDLCLDRIECLVRQVPDVVLGRCVVGYRAGVAEEIQSSVVPATGPSYDQTGKECVNPGGRSGCAGFFAQSRSRSWRAETIRSSFSIALTPVAGSPGWIRV